VQSVDRYAENPARPAGFISPCLPTKTDKLPLGSEWLHEIKHDGFRVIARKNGAQVRLYSRPGNDLTYRFPPPMRHVASTADRIEYWIRRHIVPCDTTSKAHPALQRSIALDAIARSLKEQYDMRAGPIPPHLAALVQQKPTLNYKPTLFFWLSTGQGKFPGTCL
jgi:ATP-dependent DNA ligase